MEKSHEIINRMKLNLKFNGASDRDLSKIKNLSSTMDVKLNKKLNIYLVEFVEAVEDKVNREILLSNLCKNSNVTGEALYSLVEVIIKDIKDGRIPLLSISTLFKRKDLDLDKKIEISYELKERRPDLWYNLLLKLSETGEESIKALFSL